MSERRETRASKMPSWTGIEPRSLYIVVDFTTTNQNPDKTPIDKIAFHVSGTSFLSLGPPIVPVVGSGFSFKFDRRFGFESPAQTMHRLGKKYGPVMRMRMGSDHYIFLNGKKYNQGLTVITFFITIYDCKCLV